MGLIEIHDRNGCLYSGDFDEMYYIWQCMMMNEEEFAKVYKTPRQDFPMWYDYPEEKRPLRLLNLMSEIG